MKNYKVLVLFLILLLKNKTPPSQKGHEEFIYKKITKYITKENFSTFFISALTSCFFIILIDRYFKKKRKPPMGPEDEEIGIDILNASSKCRNKELWKNGSEFTELTGDLITTLKEYNIKIVDPEIKEIEENISSFVDEVSNKILAGTPELAQERIEKYISGGTGGTGENINALITRMESNNFELNFSKAKDKVSKLERYITNKNFISCQIE